MISRRHVVIWSAALGLLVPLAQSSFAQNRDAKPAASKGTIILYTGFVGPWLDGVKGTTTDVMARRIRAMGFNTILADPANWESVTRRVLSSGDGDTPVAIIGYSLGANAAQSTTMMFQTQGRMVTNLVLIDGFNLAPIGSNVARATHFYVEALPVAASASFTGVLRNIDIRKASPEGYNASHLSVTKLKLLQDAVVAEVIDGDHIRGATPPPTPVQANISRPGRGKKSGSR